MREQPFLGPGARSTPSRGLFVATETLWGSSETFPPCPRAVQGALQGRGRSAGLSLGPCGPEVSPGRTPGPAAAQLCRVCTVPAGLEAVGAASLSRDPPAVPPVYFSPHWKSQGAGLSGGPCPRVCLGRGPRCPPRTHSTLLRALPLCGPRTTTPGSRVASLRSRPLLLQSPGPRLCPHMRPRVAAPWCVSP